MAVPQPGFIGPSQRELEQRNVEGLSQGLQRFGQQREQTRQFNVNKAFEFAKELVDSQYDGDWSRFMRNDPMAEGMFQTIYGKNRGRKIFAAAKDSMAQTGSQIAREINLDALIDGVEQIASKIPPDDTPDDTAGNIQKRPEVEPTLASYGPRREQPVDAQGRPVDAQGRPVGGLASAGMQPGEAIMERVPDTRSPGVPDWMRRKAGFTEGGQPIEIPEYGVRTQGGEYEFSPGAPITQRNQFGVPVSEAGELLNRESFREVFDVSPQFNAFDETTMGQRSFSGNENYRKFVNDVNNALYDKALRSGIPEQGANLWTLGTMNIVPGTKVWEERDRLSREHYGVPYEQFVGYKNQAIENAATGKPAGTLPSEESFQQGDVPWFWKGEGAPSDAAVRAAPALSDPERSTNKARFEAIKALGYDSETLINALLNPESAENLDILIKRTSQDLRDQIGSQQRAAKDLNVSSELLSGMNDIVNNPQSTIEVGPGVSVTIRLSDNPKADKALGRAIDKGVSETREEMRKASKTEGTESGTTSGDSRTRARNILSVTRERRLDIYNQMKNFLENNPDARPSPEVLMAMPDELVTERNFQEEVRRFGIQEGFEDRRITLDERKTRMWELDTAANIALKDMQLKMMTAEMDAVDEEGAAGFMLAYQMANDYYNMRLEHIAKTTTSPIEFTEAIQYLIDNDPKFANSAKFRDDIAAFLSGGTVETEELKGLKKTLSPRGAMSLIRFFTGSTAYSADRDPNQQGGFGRGFNFQWPQSSPAPQGSPSGFSEASRPLATEGFSPQMQDVLRRARGE